VQQAARAAAVVGILTAAVSGSAWADVVLSGPVSSAGTYSTLDLSTTATVSDTVDFGGLTGISLWGLLDGPTGITTTTPPGDNSKNAILRYYLLATGMGGQQSVVSLGEIDPTFGGTAPVPAFVAFQNTGSTLLTSADLIVPGAPGRDVTNLTSLRLLSVPALPASPPAPGGESTSVALSGHVTNPGSYSLTDLQDDFTPVSETVGTASYIGVPLWQFLDTSSSDITNQIVTTQATDGYEIVLSLAELDPALGGNPNDLLPYAGTGFPGAGVARTIYPTDNAHGRWESNLDAVIVTDAPEPASLSLLAVALASFAAMRRRSFRRAKG
jgi:hypothetical protein